MEFIIWFIVIAGLTLGSVGFVKHPWFQQKLLVKKPAPAAVAVPVKTLKQVHAEDHAFWSAEYKAILQKGCDHLYHHQRWYTCMICGYEEPWVYEEGCSCRKEEVHTLCDARPTYHLVIRQSFCTIHGIDFKFFPISDRKHGPYGPQSDSTGSVERSRELIKGRSLRKIDFNIEGTH
jgi:hypothetical protein